jgi:hypothetical protein
MKQEPLAIEHETAFVRTFIIRERRQRYLSQLSLPKKRAKLLDRLNHRFRKDLDSRWMSESQPSWGPTANQPCYIIASEREYDGRIVLARDVPEILSAAYFGIVISFVPGKIAAYKDEAPSDPIWLHRD